MATDTSFARSGAPTAVERDLAGLLVEALRLLGAQGRAHEANQIAARAWWALEHGDERARQRINGVMHHLARLPAAAPAATDPTDPGPPTTSEEPP